MKQSTRENIAFLLIMLACLLADGLLASLWGALTLFGLVGLALALVLLAQRQPRERGQKEGRPGVRTTGTAKRKDKRRPIYSTPLFYRGKRRLSN